MASEDSVFTGWQVLGVILLLLTPTLVFWRPHLPFFFIEDDWTSLIHMAELPFGQYLLQPDGEQWFPLFHLVFYGLVKMAGERYWLLLLVNSLTTGVVAFLLYLFLRRHLDSGMALVLSLFYAGAALQHAVVWNAFYICYLLSLGFYLGALLMTAAYSRSPSCLRLLGVGLFSLLAILSHNYPLLGLAALPLYAALLGAPGARGRSWPLAATVGLVYLAFALGYFLCAGFPAAVSHNRLLFSGIPGVNYLVHWLYGAFLAPFLYLFWGHFHFPIWAHVAAISLMTLSLAIIWAWGQAPEQRLALWALLANGLPLLLVSLTRYHRSVYQAFVARYGIFTLMGVLLLVGTAWRLLAAQRPRRRLLHLLGLALLGAMLLGQVFSLPLWKEQYLEKSRAAALCYRQLVAPGEAPQAIPDELFRQFCPTAHPSISRDQALAVRRFLTGTRP